MGGARVDPPPRKMETFFLMSLALSVPIYRNFKSNGGKWPRFLNFEQKKIIQYPII